MAAEKPNPNLPFHYDGTPIPLTERFLELLRFIEARGGRYQRTRKEFAKDLGYSEYQVRKITERAEDLGVMKIDKSNPAMIGVGRLPPIYILKMRVVDWMANRDDILAEEKRVRDEKLARRRRAIKTRREAEKARTKPKRKMGAPVPEKPPQPIRIEAPRVDPAVIKRFTEDETLDLEAWGDAVDFDGF